MGATNFSDGNILYAGSCNKYWGNVIESGTSGSVGSFFSYGTTGPSTAFPLGSVQVGNTYTGSGMLVHIAQKWSTSNTGNQLNIKIEPDDIVSWSGTLPTYIAGVLDNAISNNSLAWANFYQKFWSSLKVYAWLATNGSANNQLITCEILTD